MRWLIVYPVEELQHKQQLQPSSSNRSVSEPKSVGAGLREEDLVYNTLYSNPTASHPAAVPATRSINMA